MATIFTKMLRASQGKVKGSYRFLEKIAKPDSQYIAWCIPDIERNEPDFVLYQIINSEDLCRSIQFLYQREIF